MIIHKATCTSWVSGATADCNCAPLFRIRKRSLSHRWFVWPIRRADLMWEVSRRCNDGEYEPFINCESFEAARQLVNSMTWLRSKALRSGNDAA